MVELHYGIGYTSLFELALKMRNKWIEKIQVLQEHSPLQPYRSPQRFTYTDIYGQKQNNEGLS